MAGVVEVVRVGRGAYRSRRRDSAGRLVESAVFPSAAAAKAALVAERRSTSQPAPKPTMPSPAETARIVGEVLARPDMRAAMVDYKRRQDAAATEQRERREREALRDDVRRRIGPQLEDSSQVGAFLAENRDEIAARATGRFTDNGTPPPRAETTTDKPVNAAVDYLVARANATAQRRLDAVYRLFPAPDEGRP